MEPAPREPNRLTVVYLSIFCLIAFVAGAVILGWTGRPDARELWGLLLLLGTTLGAWAYAAVAQRAATRRRLQWEARLRESEDRLRQAQKMEAIGQLAGGIAHDFNNLITVISCSVGLLAEGTQQDDPKQEDIGQIKEAVDRATALTRQLLAFSRRQILKPRALDLNTAVVDIEKMLQRVLGPHIAVHTALDTRLGLILADLGQVEQVIMNLAVNARDAMPMGGALMFATANQVIRMPEPHRHGVISPGEYVTLTVRDTGQGIPPLAIDRIFEPFFSTKEQGKGTGLGLATVHGIVSQAGGHITVDSELGVGTTFVMYWPRMRTLERSIERSTERASTHAGEMRAPRDHVGNLTTDTPRPTLDDRPRILIVEDEDAIRDAATRVLQQAGFRVSSAKHGEDAVHLLTDATQGNDPIALVLTDVIMPLMGGRELVDVILSDYSNTRIVCMSGYRPDDLPRESLPDSHVPLIAKPFEAGELVSVIRNTLERPPSTPALSTIM